MTIPAGLHLTPTTPDEDEFQRWRAAQGVTHDDAEFQAWRAQHVPQAKPDVTSALPRNRDNPTGDLQATGPAILGNLANVAQGIPGMEAVEAGARSVVRRQPYREALADIRGQTSGIPAPISFAERTLGAIPLGMKLPGSPAQAGAILGAADQALSADPIESKADLVKRALKTGVGAGVGAATGKIADMAITGVRSRLAPSVGDAKLANLDKIAKADAENYPAALHAAQGREATPQLQALLENEDFGPIAARLEKSPQFRGMSRTDPRFLNEVYKTLSDQSGALQKGLAQVDPTNANVKRVQIGDIRQLKDQLLAALESPGEKAPLTLDVAPETHTVEPEIVPEREPKVGPSMAGGKASIRRALQDFPNAPSDVSAFQLRGSPGHITPGVEISTPQMRVQTAPGEAVPPFMPDLRNAIETHATNASDARAFDLGYRALHANASAKGVPLTKATVLSPEAIARYGANAKIPDSQKAQAVAGVLSRLKQEPKLSAIKVLGTPAIPFPAKALRTAPGLIRSINAPGQGMMDLLTKLGLTSLNSPFANPGSP